MVVLTTAACSSGPPAVRYPPSQPASGAASRLAYWVSRERFPEDTALPRAIALAYKQELDLADALEAHLGRLGYQVSSYALAGGDVEVTMEVLDRRGASARFPLPDDAAAILVSAWVAGRCADSAWIVFDPEWPVPSDELDRITHLITQPSVVTKALERADARAAAASSGKGAEADEDAWRAANAAACERPTTVDACDRVYAYLTQFPSGRHVAEARSVVEAGRKARDEVAKEDRYWQAANPKGCQRDGGRSCDMVQAYLIVYHPGRYESAARQMLAAHGLTPSS
jgi:hypothetical protein